MKTLTSLNCQRLAILCLFMLVASCIQLSQAQAQGNVSTAWDAPTTNADGTPLTNLAGYKIKISSTKGDYSKAAIVDINNSGVTTYTSGTLVGGQYFSVVTAYNTAGIESPPSNEISFSISTQSYLFTANKAGNGAGRVSGVGIDCGADCSESLASGATLALTATPDVGSNFTGWSGACTGTAGCSVVMDSAKQATATFTLQRFTLSAARAGSGTGTITGTGISCGTDCSEAFDYGSTVTLTAAPGSGSVFTGWTGACTGTATCSVSMTAARSVSATFSPVPTYSLTTLKSGTGSGTISGTGIACGADCTETLAQGTVVSLTATAATNSRFTGWSGDCSGSAGCSVTMSAARTVSASFDLLQYLLSVTKTGAGSGTVTGTGIACGADCSEMLNIGSVVSLSAAAASGSTFAGWSGACTGTGSCQVSLSSAQSVSANFTLNPVLLSVTKAGTGSGTVTATGINCGADCSEAVSPGTSVTLTAAPGSNSKFSGWSGACSGTSLNCTVLVNAATSAQASFDLLPPPAAPGNLRVR